MSVAKKQHIKLGHLWTTALDLEMRDGKRACERSVGPPLKCGSFDLQKLASLQTTGAALFKVDRDGLAKVRFAAVGGP